MSILRTKDAFVNQIGLIFLLERTSSIGAACRGEVPLEAMLSDFEIVFIRKKANALAPNQ